MTDYHLSYTLTGAWPKSN